MNEYSEIWRTGFWVEDREYGKYVHYADGYQDYRYTRNGWMKERFHPEFGMEMEYDKISEEEALEIVRKIGRDDSHFYDFPWEPDGEDKDIRKKLRLKHMTDRIVHAYEIAEAAHSGQTDKAGKDYINHPIAVARGVGNNESAIIVALLHDTVEDTSVTFEDLKDFLLPKEMEALKLLTRKKGQDYTSYLKQIKTNQLAVKVKLSDLRHNSDLGRLPKVTEADKQRALKYNMAIEFLGRKIKSRK